MHVSPERREQEQLSLRRIASRHTSGGSARSISQMKLKGLTSRIAALENAMTQP